MPASQLAFIGTRVQIQGDLPVEICPDNKVRRCRPNEIALIKSKLPQFGTPLWGLPAPYEMDMLVDEGSNGSQHSSHQLPEDQWRYYGLAYECGANAAPHDIAQLFCLLDPDLWFGFDLSFSEPDQGGEPGLLQWSPTDGRLARVLQVMPTGPAKVLASGELVEIGKLYPMLRTLSPEASFIREALARYASVVALEARESLVVVGLFSVIEGLMTHSPRLHESLDSISHQIRTKINLLGKLFDSPMIDGHYFHEASSKSIWTKLYAYRSCIAHGNRPNFATTLKLLKTPNDIHAFLREVTRQLLRLALRKPELLIDLREC